jgi:hypothetical protein
VSEVSWSFRNLNLEGVNAQKASQTPPPGRYLMKVSEAQVAEVKNGGGHQIRLRLTDLGGQGSVEDFIRVNHPKSGSDANAKKAVEIGLERLKALLTCGGHPSPNNPGDIRTLNGLVVAVLLEQSEDWTDDKGQTRKGGTKPKKSGAYVPATDVDPDYVPGKTGPGPGKPPPRDLDDAIPF